MNTSWPIASLITGAVLLVAITFALPGFKHHKKSNRQDHTPLAP